MNGNPLYGQMSPNSTYLEMMGAFFVQRRIGKDFLPDCIQQTMKFGGGSIMVWGCNSCDGSGLITKVEGRMNGKETY